MPIQIKRSVIFLFLIVHPFFSYAQEIEVYYADAFGTQQANLKTALKSIIRNHTQRSYQNLWSDFRQTDNKGDNKVWDMYSDVPDGEPAYVYYYTSDQCGNYNGEGSCYNREHSMPKSWFNDGYPMYTDLFHLYPTDGYVNGRRGNYPFGEVGTITWLSTNGSKLGSSSFPGYTGTVFEPIDEYKGDFARTFFYMVTCYEDELLSWTGTEAMRTLNATTYPSFQNWAIELLLKWSRNDPVNEKERDRNNAVSSIQHNRNPFIDYPQLAEYIWGDSENYVFQPHLNTNIEEGYMLSCQLAVKQGKLHISSLSPETSIRIYTLYGEMILQEKTTGHDILIVLPGEGIFIVSVTDKKGNSRNYKIFNGYE
ncbi:MAG: endonuclease [Candidatus Azobacteroides sp.]|nr:endonuclease [Candidatus Azobacteroides sp.]